MAGAVASLATTPDNRRSRVGRVRRLNRRKWTFETLPEYPLDGEEWEAYFIAHSKEACQAQAIRCHLNGWVKEWWDAS